MYIIDTYLDKDRLPILEKKELCRETQTLNSPDTIFEFLNRYFRLKDRTEEYIYLLAFDKKNHLIGVFELSHGTVDSSLISPREVFMKALLCGASGIILAHNHPSGDVSPSKPDMQLMARIKAAGEMLSVPLLDFVICGEGFYSAQQEGCM